MQNVERQMITMNFRSQTAPRPLWREPVVLGIAAVVLLASVGIVFQDRFTTGSAVDPANRAALPAGSAGGGFCDLPTPVKSTAYNPSTQKSE